MPNIHCSLLKISLLSGLFVFIAPWGFTFYYLILCFIPRNTWVIYRYAIGNAIFFQKYLKIYRFFKNTASKLILIVFSWEPFLKFYSKQSKYGLQKSHYSAKQSEQYLKVRSEYLNIQKSDKKQSQALKVYSTRLLSTIFQVLYRSFLNQNPTL